MDILYTLGTGSIYQNAEIKTSIKLIRRYAKFDRIFVIGENPNLEGIEFIPFKDTMSRTRNVFRKLCEVVDVVGYSEPVGEVVCFYMKGIQVNIPLQSFLLITEEYYEPQERKTCPTCKHQKECMEIAKETGIILLGDFCARYEKLQEPDNSAQESESAKHL